MADPADTLRVLFATSEVAPLVKTGGLADVSDALPKALAEIGVDTALLVPGYPAILAARDASSTPLATLNVPPFPPCQLVSGRLPNSPVPLWIVECASLYERAGGPYLDPQGEDWSDNHLRFGLLSRVAALLAGDSSPIAWRPHVLHCNDWQTGLAPAYLHYLGGKAAATVLTIHNLAYQGIFPSSTLSELGLPPASLAVDGVEYFGSVSFLKAGLFFADHLTTVSPSYAEEIQRQPLGFGLQGLLATRRAQLTGILNGIDTTVWNPREDAYLAAQYSARTLRAKTDNKLTLQARLGLTEDEDTLLFGAISRLTDQKGLDVLLEVLPELVRLPAQLALLGSGDKTLEQAYTAAAKQYPGQVAAVIGYNEAIAHLIEGGADAFIMPSRFEPCGLNQMYSQRYGTLPIVHATGGLIDSVTDTNETTLSNGNASGFVFSPLSMPMLVDAMQRAQTRWKDKRLWRRLQQNAMRKDFSWQTSAHRYSNLYKSLSI